MECVGVVKFFQPGKGWGKLTVKEPFPEGFTEADNANGVFVHSTNIKASEGNMLPSLEEGQVVTFTLAKEEKGWQAKDVKGEDGAALGTKLHRNLVNGVFHGFVIQYNPEKNYGWISTDLSSQLGMQHIPQAIKKLNDGRVYFTARDCGRRPMGPDGPVPLNVRRGRHVVFQLYWNEKGVGAWHVCDGATMRPLSQASQNTGELAKKFAEIQELSGAEQLAKLGEDMQRSSLYLVVTKDQGGRIIGQKGETVKRLREESGVDRISVDRGWADSLLVELRGPPPATAAAAILVTKLLNTPSMPPAPEGQPDPPPPPPGPLKARIVVPEEGFGRVVGKQRMHLAAIQEKCQGVIVKPAEKAMVNSGIAQSIEVSADAEGPFVEAVNLLAARVLSNAGTGYVPVSMGLGKAGGKDAGKGNYMQGYPYGGDYMQQVQAMQGLSPLLQQFSSLSTWGKGKGTGCGGKGKFGKSGDKGTAKGKPPGATMVF